MEVPARLRETRMTTRQQNISNNRDFSSSSRDFHPATRTCRMRLSRQTFENWALLPHRLPSEPSSRSTASTLRQFRSRIDLNGSCHASHQADAIRHLIDVDAHRHALRKAHPGEDRIYRGEPSLIRLRVRDVDATGDAADMAANELAVAHQLDGCRIALMDPPDHGLLEVAVDPVGIVVDDGDDRLTDIS